MNEWIWSYFADEGNSTGQFSTTQPSLRTPKAPLGALRNPTEQFENHRSGPVLPCSHEGSEDNEISWMEKESPGAGHALGLSHRGARAGGGMGDMGSAESALIWQPHLSRLRTLR